MTDTGQRPGDWIDAGNRAMWGLVVATGANVALDAPREEVRVLVVAGLTVATATLIAEVRANRTRKE